MNEVLFPVGGRPWQPGPFSLALRCRAMVSLRCGVPRHSPAPHLVLLLGGKPTASSGQLSFTEFDPVSQWYFPNPTKVSPKGSLTVQVTSQLCGRCAKHCSSLTIVNPLLSSHSEAQRGAAWPSDTQHYSKGTGLGGSQSRRGRGALPRVT